LQLKNLNGGGKMTKKELQNELQDVKELYFVGNQSWSKFDVYYVKGNRLCKVWIDPEETDTPPHWIKRHTNRKGYWIGGYFTNSVIGSDRTYEIAIALARWLYDQPYKFKAVNLCFTE
jgi:hypothetical protein